MLPYRLIPVVAACLLAGGCLSVDVSHLLNPELTEVRLEKAKHRTSNKILIIDVNGFITIGRGGSLSVVSRASLDEIKAALNKAEQDGAIKAVVLRIDSPGGEATASDMIYHELKGFRQRTGIPVFASVLGMGCSGAYYLACAADKIYAQPTSIVGSIGVIAHFPNLQGLADKLGYAQTTVKSGPLKDMGDPLKPMDPAALAIIQQTIDSMYGRFLTSVAEGRPALGSPEAVRPLADGRIYTPEQAVANHLIDGVAYLDEVIAWAKKEAGVVDADVVTYLRGDAKDATIYSRATGPDLQLVKVDLGGLMANRQPGFLYVWQPGLR